jgi:hypothetical protein
MQTLSFHLYDAQPYIVAVIVCAPVVGAVAYWLVSGGSEFAKGTPEEREALLKSRLNKS